MASPCVPLFLFLPQFDIICDLLLNRCMATLNLFVNPQTDTVLFWLGVVLNCTFASFFNLRWDFILKKRKRGISFNTLTVAYPLLGQFELKAIEVSESCSLLLCGQFLGPGCLFSLFKDLSHLKGVLHWSTLSRLGPTSRCLKLRAWRHTLVQGPSIRAYWKRFK